MKRIAIAHIEEIIDFSTLAEAEAFVEECREKRWNIWTDDNGNKITHTNDWMNFGNKTVDEYWTVIVRKPYKNYNCGW